MTSPSDPTGGGPSTLKIATAQLNPVVGDMIGNAARVAEAYAAAKAQGADLVLCPELVVSGYPPEDLLLRPAYTAACRAAVEKLASLTADGPALVLTSPWPDDLPRVDERPIKEAPDYDPRPYNAAVFLADGAVKAVRRKQCLPNYGVFDEPRTFRAGDGSDGGVVDFQGCRIGLLICEDMWYPEPAARLAKDGAELFLAPHGSPFRVDAAGLRLAEAQARVQETGRPLIFCNQVGGQDELIFDGGAFIVEPGGTVHNAPRFEEGVVLSSWTRKGEGWQCTDAPNIKKPSTLDLVYRAAVLGTRDYVQKSGFKSVVLGLSGGIDSALVAAIAADALGPENVHCVMLPSRYTSTHSLEDAEACAKALGVRLDTVGIEPGVVAFDEMLSALFAGREPDVTEENIQSRLRGSLLMAISNKFGAMVLTTGNKSEIAVGYATLYGDMNGGFNPLKDIYKTMVFALARWRNQHVPRGGLGPGGEVIPERIITKAPSAELRADQRDEDSLPPYEVLDTILTGLVEDELSVDDIAAETGYDAALVRHIQRLLYTAEYKRRQSAPGPKISRRNFGRDRRYPIINRWRELSDDA